MYPDAGSIWFDGRDVTTLDERALRTVRKKVAMVFQGAALFDSLSVAENIAYPLKENMPELTPEEIAARVAKNLEMVNLPGIEALRPSDLSGGMRKRVGLARAIAIEPEVILFDEPTTGLDPISTRIIDELILSMKKKLGSTQIVVTHDMDSAFRVSDRIAMLSRRGIVEQGTVAHMKASTHPDVRAFFDARL
ncbi:MAG: ATP-binding cassette domain-containing protein, partial [Archangium sp.]|nr:ATP-binding cassette domain-containing protein [Archangium sp.]